MKRVNFFLVAIFTCCISFLAQAQSAITEADKSALEGVIVEKYYVVDSNHDADTLGGALPKGAITYRIYIDLKPEYTLQLIYGNQMHPLTIQTSTTFYNNTDCGALIGYNVNYLKLNNGSFALDSWLTINSASNQYAGILKSDDADGSVLKRHSLDKADGLTNGNLPMIKPFNLDLTFFDNALDASVFSTNNGGWAAISGMKSGVTGPTKDNRILIAQLTTTGQLSFELNIQVGTPSGEVLKYVAENPADGEIKFTGLMQ